MCKLWSLGVRTQLNSATIFFILFCITFPEFSCQTIINSCFDSIVRTTGGLPPTKVIFPSLLGFGSKTLAFNILENSPTCSNGAFTVSRQLTAIDGSIFTTSTTTMVPILSDTLSTPTEQSLEYFTLDGHVRIGNEYFTSQEFCIQKLGKYMIELRVCSSSCPSLTNQILCFRKCCDLDEALRISGTLVQCIPSSTTASSYWNPSSISKEAPNLFEGSGAAIVNDDTLHFEIQDLTLCKNSSQQQIYSFRNITNNFGKEASGFRLLTDGTAIVKRPAAQFGYQILNYGEFCVDRVQSPESDGSIYFSTGTSLETQNYISVTCSSDKDGADNIIIPIVYIVLLTLSSFLLILSICIFLLLWDNQKFHTWVIVSYICSLLLLHIFLAASNILDYVYGENNNGKLGCVIVGAATHLFLLSTIFWLTLINENLWSTFRTLSIPNSSDSIEEERLAKSIWFSLLAWGIPILIVGCGLGLDYFYKNDTFILLLPHYGQSQCLLSSSAEGLYLFYPVGILLGFNILFLGLTIIRLIIYQKMIKNIIGKRNDAKWILINSYLKLLLIALFIWVFEVAAWILKFERSNLYWILIEALNLLQSVVIFTIFICRRSILEQLIEKYQCFSKFKPLCSEYS